MKMFLLNNGASLRIDCADGESHDILISNIKYEDVINTVQTL